MFVSGEPDLVAFGFQEGLEVLVSLRSGGSIGSVIEEVGASHECEVEGEGGYANWGVWG